MIEALSGFPGNVVAVACKGQVTRADYEATLIPRVAEALKAHPTLRLYYEIGADFAGIDPTAVWEDFKVGVEHLTRWERIAVVTDVAWIRNLMGVFGFLMPGTLRVFAVSDAAAAREWIAAA